jgi:hypothetical protein
MDPSRRRAPGERDRSSRRPTRRLCVALRPAPALLCLAAAAVPAPARAQRSSETLVDRVAVVVEGPSARERDAQLATLWDLFVTASLETVRRSGPDAPSVPLDLDAIRDAQRATVEQLVALREAVRLGRDAASPSLVDEARDRLAERIGGHDALRAYLRERSVSMESLDEALRREVIVERFTRDSVRLPAALDPTELEQRFASGGHPFADRPYAEVATEFEDWLRQERFEEYRQLWLVDLRSRCRLVLIDVSQGLGAPAAGAETAQERQLARALAAGGGG